MSYKNKIRSTIDHLPGALPSAPLPKELTAASVAQSASAIARSLQSDTLEEKLFTHDAFWRDLFSLTRNLRTFYGPTAIGVAWSDVAPAADLRNVKVVLDSVHFQPTWATVDFSFDADLSGLPAECGGQLSLVPDPAAEHGMKIWMMLTWLDNLKDRRGLDLRHKRQKHQNPEPTNVEHLDVLIIGGGQSGLSTAAYCKSLGLRYIVLEKNARVGDNWTTRYDSAKLHTVKRFNHLPFGPTYTDHDPEWLHTKSLAEGFRRFVAQFGIDVWTSCQLSKPATFDPTTKEWTAQVLHKDKTYTISASHIILCTGPGGSTPLRPDCPGIETYNGTSLHSGEYHNCKAFHGKRGIIVGSANTAHDVAEDMVEAGLSEVTMVQRGSTYVVPRSHFQELFGMIWNDKVSQEISDRNFMSPPTSIQRLMSNAYFHAKADEETETWMALEKTGFKFDPKGDLIDHLRVRFGGHHMDCGASQLIIDGTVKIKNDAQITHYTPTGLGFSDGSSLDADLIVWATGFEKDIRQSAEPVIGHELTAQLREFWGVDEEGEVKGAYVPSGVENCWMCGGGTADVRYFARFVTLQILCGCLGHPMVPYEKAAFRMRE
ncbi:unnamed protein product [Zymoseptoria tritici ST99CH_3D1]|uniref:FAD/NAD(P)-binding domain-containing protein n=2 Tax=Zymoseptoria tritici TaxID=1047171 RepID=F9X405_ZYMTI|nr:uncharacterized protein MYCGRDRAFT_108314 [Zymoseptoria tritici IPO323]EGP90141.1 hypothetical protein MYCGRDRAFT_108314 [Zymoseptoria tritici IPO323]SMR46686.1 unnamed protein product [Zymoseptoria tritici ST99CH_1E4]SMR47925.1 unnamed protein product [Zymoseptoria tritici ST99CH_3D1]